VKKLDSTLNHTFLLNYFGYLTVNFTSCGKTWIISSPGNIANLCTDQLIVQYPCSNYLFGIWSTNVITMLNTAYVLTCNSNYNIINFVVWVCFCFLYSLLNRLKKFVRYYLPHHDVHLNFFDFPIPRIQATVILGDQSLQIILLFR
jgi:hypothetical protein